MAQAKLDPNDVFKPAGLPLEDENVYTDRKDPESLLHKFLRRGQVPVVFGEFGVGKTTVVRRLLRDRETAGSMVYVASPVGQSLSDIFKRVLEHVGFTVETEVVQRVSNSGELGVRLIAKSSIKAEESFDTKHEVVVKSPTDQAILDVMRDDELTLVIDEVHKASAQFREDLADFIKTAKGSNSAYPAIVVIGTTLEAERLVRHDEGIDRFVKEVLIEPLSDPEARYIAVDGFRRLELDISSELVELIVRTAAGAPHIVQSICLDMAELAAVRDDTGVHSEDYEVAVRDYLKEHGRRLAGSHLRAIEHTGPRRYRKQILHAMADLPQDFATMEEIRSGVSSQLGEGIPATALSGPLRSLKEGADPVLQDVERRHGERVHNLNCFRDPAMKSFIRFFDKAEAQGLVPPGLAPSADGP